MIHICCKRLGLSVTQLFYVFIRGIFTFSYSPEISLVHILAHIIGNILSIFPQGCHGASQSPDHKLKKTDLDTCNHNSYYGCIPKFAKAFCPKMRKSCPLRHPWLWKFCYEHSSDFDFFKWGQQLSYCSILHWYHKLVTSIYNLIWHSSYIRRFIMNFHTLSSLSKP